MTEREAVDAFLDWYDQAREAHWPAGLNSSVERLRAIHTAWQQANEKTAAVGDLVHYQRPRSQRCYPAFVLARPRVWTLDLLVLGLPDRRGRHVTMEEVPDVWIDTHDYLTNVPGWHHPERCHEIRIRREGY